jgi:hypothetical protein
MEKERMSEYTPGQKRSHEVATADELSSPPSRPPDHLPFLTASLCLPSSFYYLSHSSSHLFQFIQLERDGACHYLCRVE